jgi:hypothetical protein
MGPWIPGTAPLMGAPPSFESTGMTIGYPITNGLGNGNGTQSNGVMGPAIKCYGPSASASSSSSRHEGARIRQTGAFF